MFRLTKEAFDTERGLWLATARQELYPNPHSYAKERERCHVLYVVLKLTSEHSTSTQLVSFPRASPWESAL